MNDMESWKGLKFESPSIWPQQASQIFMTEPPKYSPYGKAYGILIFLLS